MKHLQHTKKAVSEGTFPAEEHTFKMDETIIDKLY